MESIRKSWEGVGQNIGLGSGSVQHTKTSDAYADRRTMELKRVALGENVATTSQPKKKRPFTLTQEIQWQTRLRNLGEFHQIHGHCRVPRNYPQNPSLGIWVNRMRTEFKKWENGKHSLMTSERIAALNNFGFDWVVGRGLGLDNDTKWKLRLEELQEFHQTCGHCRVPSRYPLNPSLGKWVNRMRAQFKHQKERQQSRLIVERIAELNNLGFDWVVGVGNGSVDGTTWKLGSPKIREFRQTHGHQEQHHGQKEVAPAVPRRDSEEGVVDNESYWV